MRQLPLFCLAPAASPNSPWDGQGLGDWGVPGRWLRDCQCKCLLLEALVHSQSWGILGISGICPMPGVLQWRVQAIEERAGQGGVVALNTRERFDGTALTVGSDVVGSLWVRMKGWKTKQMWWVMWDGWEGKGWGRVE